MSILPIVVIMGNQKQQDKAHKSLMSFSCGLCLSLSCAAFMEGGGQAHLLILLYSNVLGGGQKLALYKGMS